MTQQLPTWVEVEAAKARKRATPKNMPQRKPEPLRFHVNVALSGSIDFELEGRDAIGLRELLNSGAEVAEVIDYLDPWSSGAELNQVAEIIEAPARWGGLHLQIDEISGGIYHLGGKA